MDPPHDMPFAKKLIVENVGRLITRLRQRRIKSNIIRNSNTVFACARSDHTPPSINQCRDVCSAPNRSITIRLQQRRGLQGISL